MSHLTIIIVCTLVFAASWLMTWQVKKWAIKKNIMDCPNERSSHQTPTPRGGGLAVFFVFMVSMVFLSLAGFLSQPMTLALLGGLPVFAVGLGDDVFSLSPKLRLMFHALAAIWLIYWLPPNQFIVLGGALWPWGSFEYIVSFLGIIWLINSYNFMDGID
ncbi:MAG: glycosyltransferase family 4 protein, partial [Candidatus Adiutrix sp.]